MRPRFERTCGLTVRWANPNTPRKTRPITITTTPSTRVIGSWYWMKNRPTEPASTPIATNTTVNPAMKSTTPSSRRPRRAAVRPPPAPAVAPPTPVVVPPVAPAAPPRNPR